MEPFERVVAEHGAVVLRVCRALLGSVDADDAWSETFLAAMRAYPELRPDSNVRAWLVTIAHHKAIDQLRAAGRGPVPTSGLPEQVTSIGVPDAVADADGDALRVALDTLSPKQRGAVVAHHLGGLPYREVAELLECSEAAARRNAADGIAALRRTYGKGGGR